ncbi:MAG: hypothetical protein NTV06_07460, partial [candidate division Zixibacteria bacterium]|nr:hypothetical protein [candidate division Zixibacteria bacterium]
MSEKPPKIRNDLIIKETIRQDGSKYFVIKDPITYAFFKVGEPEYFIISSFDGHKTISQIVEVFKSKFNLDIDENSVDGFIRQLQELCFLDNDLTCQELLKKQRTVSWDGKPSFLGKLLFIKLKAVNPGPLFDRLIKHLRFFFTRGFVRVAIALILLGSLVMLYNGREIGESLIRLISFQGIIIIYLSMTVVIVFHEFAHGLTCKFYGGEVRDLGFLLLYFQPAFYCNVSDAWLFGDKYKRLWVSFAGGFIQFLMGALAVLVWRVTAADTLINQFSIAILSFSGIAALFNFNPLLRYDGYYMLSDYLEIPNLRQRAGRYWKNRFKQIFLSAETEIKDLSEREKRIYFYYGILSFIYITFVLGYFFLLAAHFFVSRLGGTGFVIFVAIMVFLFRNIIMDTIQGTGEFVKTR